MEVIPSREGSSAQEGAALCTKIWVLFPGEDGEIEAGEASAKMALFLYNSLGSYKSHITVKMAVPCTCRKARLQQATCHEGTDLISDPYLPL